MITARIRTGRYLERIDEFVINHRYTRKHSTETFTCIEIKLGSGMIVFRREDGSTLRDLGAALRRYAPADPYTQEELNKVSEAKKQRLRQNAVKPVPGADTDTDEDDDEETRTQEELDRIFMQPPVEVPRTITARQYLDIIHNSRPD